MKTIWADQALTSEGWKANVVVSVGEDGIISKVDANANAGDQKVGALLPSPANIHSHSFQRAMAGMTEQRGDDPDDNFWTWRKLMYKFLDHLTPEDIQSIAAFTQMEMLEAGFSTVAEFHYLHHQADGTPYDNIAELSDRIAAAAIETGIGLTLLPVNQRPLGAGQIRFGNDFDRFAKLYAAAKDSIKPLASDARNGIAPHSLRAVGKDGLAGCVELSGNSPLHIHIAEQIGEVDEVEAAWGQRPVNWLYDNHDVDERWCLIHATQMHPEETEKVAKSRAVAGLCPITESNLGDGVFDGIRFLECDGIFGIGSDSNIRISLSEELRTLEYSQRLMSRKRSVLATEDMSTGRRLYQCAVKGGARAAARNSGSIEVGKLADLMALDTNSVDLSDKSGDAVLDSYIFAGNDSMVSDVWAAGRHVVSNGFHHKRADIEASYRATLSKLKSKL